MGVSVALDDCGCLELFGVVLSVFGVGLLVVYVWWC